MNPMIVRQTNRTAIALGAVAALISVSTLVAADSAAKSPAPAGASLSLDQVVDNLVRRTQERAQALLHSEATRVYRLVYTGFPGDREADMTVAAIYDRPSSKQFKVVSENG